AADAHGLCVELAHGLCRPWAMRSLVMHKSNEQSEAGLPSSIDTSSLAHLVARQVLVTYCGSELPDAALPGSKLGETAIQMVCDFIEANLGTQLTLEELAALVYLSPFHFARCFKASMDLAPHQYVIARRMELAKRLILTTTRNVAEIAWSIGYENISHFRRLFTMHIGVIPDAIRRAGIELGDKRKNRPPAA